MDSSEGRRLVISAWMPLSGADCRDAGQPLRTEVGFMETSSHFYDAVNAVSGCARMCVLEVRMRRLRWHSSLLYTVMTLEYHLHF